MNPLKTSVKSVGNFVRSVPDNFVDGITKMSGGMFVLLNIIVLPCFYTAFITG